jgi:hypothetical protein
MIKVHVHSETGKIELLLDDDLPDNCWCHFLDIAAAERLHAQIGVGLMLLRGERQEPPVRAAATYQPGRALTTVIAGDDQFWLTEDHALALAEQLLTAVQIRRRTHPAQTGAAMPVDPNPVAGQVP